MTTGVRWLSVGPGNGYGDAGEAYRAGLRAAGVPVSWTPLGWPSPIWNAPHGPLEQAPANGVPHGGPANRAIEHDTVVVHSPPLWHPQLVSEADGRLLVACTTWETDRLPDDWVDILNRYDRVLVPSRFNAAVFERSGVHPPVHVVPHIVRRSRRAPLPPQTSDTFVFYLIATWTSRKAILDAVSAFVRAFTGDDRARLVIQTTRVDHIAAAQLQRSGTPQPPAARETWFSLARALAGHRSVPAITLGTRLLARHEIDALHDRCDCFLLLSHGEGWGLGAFEAAAAGNPVIVTGWGGTLSFLPDGYPYCVDYDLVPTVTAPPDSWWGPRPGERWANARIEHAAALLRHVFEHREEARGWGRALQLHVRACFSPTRVTQALLGALECR